MDMKLRKDVRGAAQGHEFKPYVGPGAYLKKKKKREREKSFKIKERCQS